MMASGNTERGSARCGGEGARRVRTRVDDTARGGHDGQEPAELRAGREVAAQERSGRRGALRGEAVEERRRLCVCARRCECGRECDGCACEHGDEVERSKREERERARRCALLRTQPTPLSTAKSIQLTV